MRKILNICVIPTIIIGLFVVACNSEKSFEMQRLEAKVKNIETFARLYGYARWFHPSDEAQEIDWDKFAVLGVQKVENIKSTVELRDTLYNLFSPIVQGLQIYETQKQEIFNPAILLFPDPDAKPVAWQHRGVYLNEQSTIYYKSIRTNKSEDDKENERTTVAKYFLDASYLNGKEVKFSGYFKSNKGGTKLFIQPITSLNNLSDNKKHEALIESQNWRKYELSLTIPKETISIFYGFEIEGDAEVWVDDFEFVVKTGGKWILADTANMSFERGKVEYEVKLDDDWMSSMMRHTIEVTDENPYSGNYCLKINYTGKMFERMPQFGEITKASIGNNLICVVPLTLLSNGASTWPKTKIPTLARLQSELAQPELAIISAGYGFHQQANLASVIIIWNVLQHFFPYFDVIDVNWNNVLGETLKNTLENKRKKDFFVTLSQMLAKIEDGHGVVYSEQMYHLPIRTELIENKIVITASRDTTLKRGDIIKKIDEKPVMEALDEKEKIISGSPQLRRHRALNILGSKLDPDKTMNNNKFQFVNNNIGNELDSGATRLVIDRDGKEQNVTVKNISRYKNLFFNLIEDRQYLNETIIEIEPKIFYINTANCTEKEFEQKKDVLANAKAVIYDQRSVSGRNFLWQIVPYWIKEPVNSTWWYVPQTVYPNRKEVEFSKSNWNIQPKQPFFKSKSIIINDPSVMSNGETIMDIIDHYNLATTVGEPTGGCNGNYNIVNLPCGYSIMWTGMKVLKHDGSQLYLEGFVPDYPVNKTIQAIMEGRDEFLEKALEVAKQE